MTKPFAINVAATMTALGITAGTAAHAANFGPAAGIAAGSTVTFNVTVPTGDTGDRTLTVNYAGDIGSASTETIELRVDGNVVATLTGTSDCDVTSTQTITLPASLYDAAAADGNVELVFDATAQVQPNCGDGFGPYAAPFTAFNNIAFSPISSFVVAGTLALPVVVPPTAPPSSGGGDSEGGAPPAPSAAIAIQQQETVAALRGTGTLINAPNITRRIDRLEGGDGATSRGLSFEGMSLFTDTPMQLDVGRNQLSFAGTAARSVWVEGSVVGIDDSVSNDQTFGILHAGIDRQLFPGMLVGISLQFDRLETTEAATGDTFDGTGWLAGPYVTARLAPNLVFDGRLALGRVDTDVDLTSGGTDSFSSDRQLAQIAVVGDHSYADFVIAPRAELGWYRETSDAYTSGVFGLVGESEIELGQAVLGGRVSRETGFGGGSFVPYVDLSTIYTYYGTGTMTAGSFGEAIEGWSGRLGLGAQYTSNGGSIWSFETGLTDASNGASATSLMFDVTIPF
ncbi:autotransporter domain-containing protein [Tropicimonas sp. S265A]|uniref:autotransporter domain-containing protein n=1 Tax=Tropicimonas sp. S265A TaxID=3415134 RepID=UPI003C7BF0B6